jgi:RNA polymerase sigma-70 factor (ECF subfamily)
LTATASNKILIRYEELFRTHFAALCYFARKYVPDQDVCKEIVHIVFVNIWEKKEEFDFEKSAKSYLFTAVYNRCMNYIRDQKKFVRHDDPTFDRDNSENTLNVDYLEAAELESRIWKIINSLPEKCREIFILNRFEGKKYAEIADNLQISVKTVETQMSKALKILRDHLVDYLHLILFFIIKNLW